MSEFPLIGLLKDNLIYSNRRSNIYFHTVASSPKISQYNCSKLLSEKLEIWILGEI